MTPYTVQHSLPGACSPLLEGEVTHQDHLSVPRRKERARYGRSNDWP
jgi:hypothetical protein